MMQMFYYNINIVHIFDNEELKLCQNKGTQAYCDKVSYLDKIDSLKMKFSLSCCYKCLQYMGTGLYPVCLGDSSILTDRACQCSWLCSPDSSNLKHTNIQILNQFLATLQEFVTTIFRIYSS